MLTPEQHLDSLVRHIEMVRAACLLLGRRLIAEGRGHFGRLLIAKGFVHDASKFYGMEWQYMTTGQDVPPAVRDVAIEHHRQTNAHHPEYWGGFENMPEIAVAEMACDCYARSQEFGTDLRQWVRETAVPRYQIDTGGERYAWLEGFIERLLARPFTE